MPGRLRIQRKTIQCNFCPEQIVPMGAKGFENVDGSQHKCRALQKSYSIHPNNPGDSAIQTNIDDKIPGLELEIRKLQKENFEIRDELNCFTNKRKTGESPNLPNPIETLHTELETDGNFY